MIRTFRELRRLGTFEERYEYLKLNGHVGESTFGYDRYANQILYTSQQWRRSRDLVIMRDNGCDLGMEGYEIYDRIIIHHMNPITIEDIELERPEVFDPEFLICTSKETHRGIHYGSKLPSRSPVIRRRNDTCPWIK